MKLKQKDMVLIAAGLFGGILLAIVVGKVAFSNSSSQNSQVEVVPSIHTDFPTPSNQYFNSQAIDPTQIINIGPNNSQQPFNSGQ